MCACLHGLCETSRVSLLLWHMYNIYSGLWRHMIGQWWKIWRISGSWDFHLPVKQVEKVQPPVSASWVVSHHHTTTTTYLRNNSVSKLRLVVKELWAWVPQLKVAWIFVPYGHVLHFLGTLYVCSIQSKNGWCMDLCTFVKEPLSKGMFRIKIIGE